MDNINLSGVGGMGESRNVDRVQHSVPQKPASASQDTKGDEVKISSEGSFASSLVSEVAEMPPTRPEVVQKLQETVRGGNYPPPVIVDGLARLMGQNLQAEQPKSES
ncbi:MAG: hypothetical protein ACOY3I_04830 [Verrucomicrobiota bacterium]